MKPMVRGISIDSKGTKLIDDVINVQQTGYGYSVQVTVPDVSVGGPTVARQERSLKQGVERPGFTIQLSLSSKFLVIDVAFYQSTCINDREFTPDEFNIAAKNALSPFREKAILYKEVAEGLGLMVNEKIGGELHAQQVVTAFLVAVNTLVGVWSVKNNVDMPKLVLGENAFCLTQRLTPYSPITSPLRKASHRENLLVLIANQSPCDQSPPVKLQDALVPADLKQKTLALFKPSPKIKEGGRHAAIAHGIVRRASRYQSKEALKIIKLAESLNLLAVERVVSKHSNAYTVLLRVEVAGETYVTSASAKTPDLAEASACSSILSSIFKKTLPTQR